ncbi:uncharacterized protein LOC141715030 [Apium graveolens]|uniref:uncharacterized protein LOC141715030 n=1 Tax=Apium graveolens TaxID=4045 RepID=UPI003D7BD42D
MELSTKLVKEWEEANQCKTQLSHGQPGSITEEQVVWRPPEAGFYKLNVDASLHSGESMFALGLIVRHDRGQFIMGKNMKIAGELSVMEAEATRVYEVIKWINSTDLHHVVIESDSQLVVHALHAEDSYQLEVGHIIDECKEKLKEQTDLSVLHVEKQANKAAHLMTRVPYLLDSYNYFISPPELLLEMLPSNFQVNENFLVFQKKTCTSLCYTRGLY